jgi:hypothetical protein
MIQLKRTTQKFVDTISYELIDENRPYLQNWITCHNDAKIYITVNLTRLGELDATTSTPQLDFTSKERHLEKRKLTREKVKHLCETSLIWFFDTWKAIRVEDE